MAAVCIALAIAGGMMARLGTGLRALSETVVAGRSGAGSARAPLWRRLYLDIVALAISGLIYWLTASTGFSAVVNPDSNPTLSLSIYMFFAPDPALDRRNAALGAPAGNAVQRRRSAPARQRAATEPAHLPARERLAPRSGDQPRPDLRRPAARLRGQPRRLRRHLQPAGRGRRAADPRRRRHRHRTAGRDREEGSRQADRSGFWSLGRPRLSTTPMPMSGPTCRTPSESTRRRSAPRRRCATPTSSVPVRRRCSTA